MNRCNAAIWIGPWATTTSLSLRLSVNCGVNLQGDGSLGVQYRKFAMIRFLSTLISFLAVLPGTKNAGE